MARDEIARPMAPGAAFRDREGGCDREMAPFHHMVNGERESMLEAMERFWGEGEDGKLSEDPLQNEKYRFVSSVTMACRFCVEWGMEPKEAYDASDRYIRRMDTCQLLKDIQRLKVDMMCFYCDAMKSRRKKSSLSLPVIRAMDYIEAHLHERLTLESLAGNAGVSRAYLSALFHRETGQRVSDYIAGRRIETAKNMLRYTLWSAAEIGGYLGFSNPSHFQRAFKKETGMTPNTYRRSVVHYAMRDR